MPLINEVIILLKPSVFKLSNHGFLLVEHLIALSITALLILLITKLLPLTMLYQTNFNQTTYHEISTLRTQLQKETQRATHFFANNSEFQIHLENGTIPTYYISNHRLMRQVGGKGGEVALYHCEKLTTSIHHDQSVTLTLEDSSGTSYTIYLSSYLLPLEIPEKITVLEENELPSDSTNEDLTEPIAEELSEEDYDDE